MHDPIAEEAKAKLARITAVEKIIDDIRVEVLAAMNKFPPFNSAHEGYSVLDEERDELWEHVRGKQGGRDIEAMRKEAVQVAAMALRFIHDVCDNDRGQK